MGGEEPSMDNVTYADGIEKGGCILSVINKKRCQFEKWKKRQPYFKKDGRRQCKQSTQQIDSLNKAKKKCIS